MTKTLDTINGKQECIDSAYGFKEFSPQSLAPIDSGSVVGQSTMEGGYICQGTSSFHCREKAEGEAGVEDPS